MSSPGQIISALAALAVSASVGFIVIPEPARPFMVVNDMRVVGDTVFIDRTIQKPRRIADWRVTVLNENSDEPFCQTVPGRGPDRGWSVYTPGDSVKSMLLDVWVGDPGCSERLEQGRHMMFVTWTPRDGGPPVTAKAFFDLPG